ncbi:MAG TPA: heme exporter protein CcmB [Bacteroidales bacterium]|nr:heme exporter protein CcmB [Bacteroidales bacterium]
MYKPIGSLFAKELKLEWRQKAAINGVFLYFASTVFVCYLSFSQTINPGTWNSLFWVILLFTGVNVTLKSFTQEREGLLLYYYMLLKPHWLINAKILYNGLVLSVLSIAGLLVFVLFMGNPIENLTLFVINMVLGVVGFSSVLSMVSAIASKARNNFTLMAILGFPLTLPLLLVLIRVSLAALEGSSVQEQAGNLLVIVLLSAITLVLSNILFPFIWKE